MKNQQFQGIFTALVTPFSDDGQSIDINAFSNLVEWQIDQGIHGLVPCGTTGETPVLSDDEYKQVVKLCIEVANGRVPVIVGAGSNNTSKSVEMAKHAQDSGADAILVVAPYYNKPSQDGMIKHFSTIAEATSLPLITYNIPGRSIVDMTQDTLATLSQIDNIIGVKDATGDLARPTSTRKDCGTDFIQLSGEDATIAGFLAQGGHGAISVSSNVAPALYRSFYDAWITQDIETFSKLRDQLHPLTEAMFTETSPAPVKYALSQMDMCQNVLRSPLIECSKDAEAKVSSVMKALSNPANMDQKAQSCA
jgi:4-hydroxy-tetrahydrodipicolinate synthase